MAVTQVTIPYNEANPSTRRGWEKEVSTELEAGNDVQFVDETGVERNVHFLGLFNATDGSVKRRGANVADANAVTQKLVSGGYVELPTAYIYSSGTDTGLKIHVRLG